RGGFPAATDTLLRNLGTVIRILEDKLPNVKLAYLTSRIYAGYASSTLNPEPYAYESGFAVKWLIDAQIAGVDSLNWNANVGPVEAPWLSWGPYLWADRVTPRRHGLPWASWGTYRDAESRSWGAAPEPERSSVWGGAWRGTFKCARASTGCAS